MNSIAEYEEWIKTAAFDQILSMGEETLNVLNNRVLGIEILTK
ncbi:hypothetical protein [Pedobacter sp.]